MIKLEKVSKKFGTGVFGLVDINLSVDKKEFVFLVGPTGSGKTTIFRLLTREILPTEGIVIVNDWDLTRLPKHQVPHLRKKIGVVFQDLKLLFDRTVFENVLMPLEVTGVKMEEATQKVKEVLTQIGIIGHKDKFPIQLSGGELQRTAIARALVLSPQILLADEPTGNLDSATSWEIVKLLSDINEKGTTVIMATHNTDIVKSMDMRTIHIDRGKIVKDENIKHVVIKEKEKDEKGENKDDKEVKEK